jgi:hypothetical protein
VSVFGKSAVLSLCLLAGVTQGAVRASLDSTSVALGDAVQLRLQRDTEASGMPNLTPLQQDFDVLSTSSSRTLQIVNGSTSMQIATIVMLSPKHAGTLTIPALDWSGESSTPITLTVTPGGGATNSSGATAPGKKVFIETSVDSTEPFLQQGVHVTVRIYMGEPLTKAGMDFPASNDALIEQIQSDTHHDTVRNGEPYTVVERHYLLFPQKSGDLTVAGPVLEGQVAVHIHGDQFGNDPFADLFGAGAGMMVPTRPIRVQGDPIVLHVRPRPAAAGSGPWIPARDVTLTAQWHPDSMQVHVGDPITLNLHLEADGLTAAQLPDLSTLLDPPAGLKAYPDQAKLSSVQRSDTVFGTRDQAIALVADQPGNYVLPPLHVSWWDTKANALRQVNLPASSLTVLPAVGAAPAATSAAVASAPSTSGVPPPRDAVPAAGTQPVSGSAMSAFSVMQIWILISAVLALLWLVTMFAWWRSRRSRTAPPRATGADAVRPNTVVSQAVTQPVKPASVSQARAQFREACRRNDAQAARRALLAWTGAAWPREPAVGLEALAKRMDGTEVSARLLELDRACFAGAPWDGAALSQALKDLPTLAARTGAAGGDGPAPLYPR